MNDFSVGMALVDYVPVILFAVAAVFLQRDLYNKMSKGAFALFAAGTIDVFCAGLLKATYKLLYAANICNFEALSVMFFPLQAIGFLLAGVSIVAMLCFRQNANGEGLFAAAVAPASFSGTFIFVALMVLGLGGINFGMCIVSKKMKKPLAIVFFVLSFVFSLAMGYLSSKDFSQAYMNWVAQGVNILGQGCMLAGSIILHKARLIDFNIKGEVTTDDE